MGEHSNIDLSIKRILKSREPKDRLSWGFPVNIDFVTLNTTTKLSLAECV